ncbi:MAG TPA: hypothetical protein VH880_12650, partial [Anaeromyxobacteraceae bacterium]
MRRLLPVSLLAAAGCIVVPRQQPVYTQPPPPPEPVAVAPEPAPVPYAPAPAPAPVYWYGGQHVIPDYAGGGWCYIDGVHDHPYYPEYQHYHFYEGVYYWTAPLAILFHAGHPVPGGGWCFIGGA